MLTVNTIFINIQQLVSNQDFFGVKLQLSMYRRDNGFTSHCVIISTVCSVYLSEENNGTMTTSELSIECGLSIKSNHRSRVCQMSELLSFSLQKYFNMFLHTSSLQVDQ